MQSRELMPEGLAAGLGLLREHRADIEPHEGAYTVPDGPEMFRVSPTPGGGLQCGCGAFCGPGSGSGTVCEHIWAARLAHAGRVAANEAEMAIIDAGGRVR